MTLKENNTKAYLNTHKAFEAFLTRPRPIQDHLLRLEVILVRI